MKKLEIDLKKIREINPYTEKSLYIITRDNTYIARQVSFDMINHIVTLTDIISNKENKIHK